MEFNEILDNILDGLHQEEQGRKQIIHAVSELMDQIREYEIIRLCVYRFVEKAAAVSSDDEYAHGYVAAAADLTELIDIATGQNDIAAEEAPENDESED